MLTPTQTEQTHQGRSGTGQRRTIAKVLSMLTLLASNTGTRRCVEVAKDVRLAASTRLVKLDEILHFPPNLRLVLESNAQMDKHCPACTDLPTLPRTTFGLSPRDLLHGTRPENLASPAARCLSEHKDIIGLDYGLSVTSRLGDD